MIKLLYKATQKRRDILKTQFASELDSTEGLASYDSCCKNLLSYKCILSHILKECVVEFKDYDVHYIEENCFDGNPQVSEVPVHRGNTEKIVGLNTEDKTIDEGNVFFDIRFVAVVPQTGEPIKLIINLEAQNEYNTKYPLVTRALYYCCRLISAQHETEFTHDNYQDIKKVYSIWICPNVPKYAQSTMTRYKITEENAIGKLKSKIKAYDLLEVVFLCLDEDTETATDSTNGILKMLRVLLSDKMKFEGKKTVLNGEFDVAMNVKMQKELINMCNLSAGAVKKGWISGKAEGKTEGIELGKLESLRNLMKSMSITFDEAVKLLLIPQNEVEIYRSKI
jgi:hypothetical protein